MVWGKGGKKDGTRTWTKSNTLRKQNASTIKGKVQATLRSLQSNFLTLGSGNLYQAIDIPEEMFEDAVEMLKERGLNESEARKQAKVEALNEWVAANTVDFFNEIGLLYGLVQDYHQKNYQGKDQGFPQGYNYRFPGMDIKNGSAYVDAVSAWIEDQIDNPTIFPEMDTDPFPPNFIDGYMKKIYKRMIRIFAIMYARCIPSFKEIEAVPHLNTAFKHFYYFVKRYDLLDDQKEFEALGTSNVKKDIMSLKTIEENYLKDKMEAEKAKK